MTAHVLNRRELLGATAAVAALSLAGAVACDGRQSGANGETAGLSGIALVRAELARLLETYRLPMEAGYRTLEDGMRMIASIHHVPNVNGAMVEWWLRRRKTDEEFRMWHPKEHVHWEWDEKLRAGIAHHLIDGEIEKTKGQARDAADYFDTSSFAEHGVSAAICARGGPADTDGWGGHLVHLCRDTDYGCEVRTRLFIGDFDPAPNAVMRSIMLRFISDERARWLMRHQSEEYVYLSQFLPALYKREAA
jgi:hypothetical protein